MESMKKIKIQPITKKNREIVNEILLKEWNSLFMIVRGKKISLNEIDGIIAYDGENIIGIITYLLYDDTLEIISLNSLYEGKGIGTLLIEEVKKKTREEGKSNIKVITTNDNINAIKFYQRRSFIISNVYINSIEKYRKIKPNIPQKGIFDIPIRDEIEFVFRI